VPASQDRSRATGGGQGGSLRPSRSVRRRARGAGSGDRNRPATGECYYQAELHRLRGAVLAETGDPTGAASWLQQAIDTARGQQAKSLELRAAMSLARLWRNQGRRAQAYDLLAPVYDWFTEGFETADLRDAKALLDELA
jgi:predicted ATPase